MTIAVRCEGCGYGFRVQEEHAGRRGKCPKCGAVVQVPSASASPNAARPKPASDSLTGNSLSVKQSWISAPPSDNPKPPGMPAKGTTPTAAGIPAPPSHSPRSPERADAAEQPNPGELDSQHPPDPFALGDPSSDQIRGYVARQQNRVQIPIWTWFVVGGMCLAAMVAVAAYRRFVLVPGSETANPPQATAEGEQPPPAPQAVQAAEPGATNLPKPAPGASREDIVEYIKHGIVKLDTYDQWNNCTGLGSGFVIDPRGLVATNYHVVDQAVKADALFVDGTRYGIEGYVGVMPESDLAILKLNGLPADMNVLELAPDEGPRDAADVFAIGHPEDHVFMTTRGIMSRLVLTSQLPEESRTWLGATLGDRADNLWIAHDARISPGNSGGPLLDAQGRVIGINSWVHEGINLGYAIHARHLRALLQKASATPRPMREFLRRPEDSGATLARGLALQPDELRALRDECMARGCQAETAEAYTQLCTLARGLTVALYLRGDGDDEPAPPGLKQLGAEAQTTLRMLHDVKWSAEHREQYNRWMQELPDETMAGRLFFAKVEQTFDGKEGDKALLVSLDGTDKSFFIPLTGKQAELRTGTHVLVVGILYGGSIEFGDNPLKQQSVPIVWSQAILPVRGG